MKTLLLLVTLAAGAAWTAPAVAQGRPALAFPLACALHRTCEIQHYVDRDPGPGTRDYRCGVQTYDGHKGIDIRLLDMAAQKRGVDVLAAAAGKVTGVRDGEADISIRAPGAPSIAGRECGNGVVIEHGDGWRTQYCHLAKGSVRVKSGDTVAAGQPIGRVGLSGDTEFPHLHLQVSRANAIVDPFDPDAGPGAAPACAPKASLWTPQAAAAMSYQAGAVLNAGFASAPVTMAQVEDGVVPPAGAAGAYLVAYGRGIGLRAGDEIEMDLRAPSGESLAHNRLPPLDRWKAQALQYIGKKRPATGWPPGIYVADYKVWRAGKVAFSRRFEIRL